MSFGPATLLSMAAAALATLLWWLTAGRLPDWVRMFLFGVVLLLIFAVGPLVRLP